LIASARHTGRMDLNGFGLIGDYEHLRGGVVTFSGHYVHTVDLTGPGTLVTRGELSEDGAIWTTLFEGRHRRVRDSL
jgi:hypothetical protein